MKAVSRLWGALAVIGVLLAALSPAQAVPAWTRKTGLDCTSCHMGGSNRLTRLGYQFLMRGHRLKTDEGINKENMKTLNYLDYASFASKWRYTANNSDVSTGIDVEAFSLYTGGPLSGKFSYFVEYYFHERGGFSNPAGSATSTTTNRSKLADAYIQYSTNPQGEAYWYGRAGQFYPYTIYMASSGGRLSINRPLAINANLGGGNLYTPRDRAYGLSVGYVNDEKGYSVEAAVVNSAGTNARPNLEEKNNFKDAYLTVEKSFDEHGSALSLYAYTGRFLVPSGTAGLSGGRVYINNWEDRFNRLGVLASFVRPNWLISGGYFFGENQLPAPSNLGSGTPPVASPPTGYTGGKRNPSGYYFEGGYNLSDSLTGYARYDHIYNDLVPIAASRSNGFTFGLSQRTGDVGRIVLEFSGYKSGSSAYSRQMQVEFNWLF
jgi:hypothetical protein